MKYDVQLCEVLRRAQTAENTFDYTVLAPKLAEGGAARTVCAHLRAR